jgi:hypothetical protein
VHVAAFAISLQEMIRHSGLAEYLELAKMEVMA